MGSGFLMANSRNLAKHHILEQVKEIIQEYLYIDDINDEDDLLWDLGISGDDAHEVFVLFSDRFDVDFSSYGIDLAAHFGPERTAFNPLFILALFRPSWWRARRERTSQCTVNDVADLILKLKAQN